MELLEFNILYNSFISQSVFFVTSRRTKGASMISLFEKN